MFEVEYFTLKIYMCHNEKKNSIFKLFSKYRSKFCNTSRLSFFFPNVFFPQINKMRFNSINIHEKKHLLASLIYLVRNSHNFRGIFRQFGGNWRIILLRKINRIIDTETEDFSVIVEAQYDFQFKITLLMAF